MTIGNETADEIQDYSHSDPHSESESGPSSATVNVGGSERAASIAAGVVLAAIGLRSRSTLGLIATAVGGGLVYRGSTGHCPAYEKLGMDSSASTPESLQQKQQKIDKEIATRGIHVEQAFLIDKPAEELYTYWRNFENLPKIMSHLKSVTVTEDRKSHWVTSAPRLVGGSVEWDAEITQDEPNSLIAWRSLPGSQVDHTGEIRFSKALGDRGTEVHVTMKYVPLGGQVGHWIAKLFGESPRHQMREDIRNFKRLMETGEIATIAGQPRGTCTGQGTTEPR